LKSGAALPEEGKEPIELIAFPCNVSEAIVFYFFVKLKKAK